MNGEMLEYYIRQYHDTVFRLAYSYLRNQADADDITQEVFLRLYNFHKEFDGEEGCKAWLIRVTINLSKNLIKSGWFTRRAELDENIPYQDAPEEDYNLLSSVMQLPQKYRVTIHLYYYEGYSVKEIADMLGVSASNITTRLARAREKLRTILQKEEL